ncbi:MAG: hypothetical protein GY913_27455, partial [Proteobacteria bacterium]|nr:hypothetical protein [Pseudomonadota bacterium]
DDDDATGDDDDATSDDDDATGDDDDSAAAVDADGDGFSTLDDCDDADPNVFPGAPESCAAAIDNDCDPSTDCQGACAPAITYAASCTGSTTFAGPAPLVLWDFEDNTALLADASSNGYDGSATGGLTASSPGWIGDAGDFASAYGEVNAGAPNAWTSSQWINLDALPTEDYAMLAANGNGSAGYTGWAVVVSGAGMPGAYVESGNSAQETLILGSDAVCTGGWVHVAATWDAGTLSVYVDGVLAVSTVAPFSSILAGSLPFVVGYDMNQNRRWVDGALDEVMLVDSVLSGGDIAALASDGFCGLGL